MTKNIVRKKKRKKKLETASRHGGQPGQGQRRLMLSIILINVPHVGNRQKREQNQNAISSLRGIGDECLRRRGTTGGFRGEKNEEKRKKIG